MQNSGEKNTTKQFDLLFVFGRGNDKCTDPMQWRYTLLKNYPNITTITSACLVTINILICCPISTTSRFDSNHNIYPVHITFHHNTRCILIDWLQKSLDIYTFVLIPLHIIPKKSHTNYINDLEMSNPFILLI